MLTVLKTLPARPSDVQPPEKLTAYLRDALIDLKRKVDASVPKAATRVDISTSVRYQDAISGWIATLTPVQRQRRFSMDEIIKLAGVRGIDGRLASVQVMGDALQSCGFTQGRDWTKAGRNQRFWKMKE